MYQVLLQDRVAKSLQLHRSRKLSDIGTQWSVEASLYDIFKETEKLQVPNKCARAEVL